MNTVNIESSVPSAGTIRQKLIRMMIIRLFLIIPCMGLMFFLPAGTFGYWNAWIYMGLLLSPMTFALVFFLKTDPGLLERRMRMKEKESTQRTLLKSGYIFFFGALILPGFDYRFEWSLMPVWLTIAGDALVLAGYIMVLLVFRQNSFASRIIEVEDKQKVITTGFYGIVRHPMYTGFLMMYFFTPLALGSYWALIPAAFIPVIIIIRILNEEKVLGRDLEGYTEYMNKVKYRLVPGIW